MGTSKDRPAGVSRRVTEYVQVIHELGENPADEAVVRRFSAARRELDTFTTEENLDTAMLLVKRQLARPGAREFMEESCGPGGYEGAVAEVAEWERKVRERQQ